jgi:hypothetical protein
LKVVFIQITKLKISLYNNRFLKIFLTNHLFLPLVDAFSKYFKDCFYVTLYRDEERGDVVVDRPSPKLSLLPQSANLTVNKYKFSPSMNNFSPFESNSRKLAAYVGPVSPQNVS